MLAAASSSAALGFTASEAVTGDWQASYVGEDWALSFSLSNSEVNFKSAAGMSIEDLANNKMVRLADGGPVDNSAVAQVVAFLQQNKQADGFNIVAFDNVQEIYANQDSTSIVGIDIANLFGAGVCKGPKYCLGLNCGSPCMAIPELQVFETAAVETTPITWMVSTDTSKYGQALIYTKYTVKTKDNSAFGVSGGSTGTLHAFTCVWSNASTEPLNDKPNTGFVQYQNMLQFIQKGLGKNGDEGLKHLQTALGLSN